MQAGLCRMRTESLVAPSPPAGKRFLDARDERPQTAPASNAARTAWNAGSHPHRASTLHPVQETAIIPVCSVGRFRDRHLVERRRRHDAEARTSRAVRSPGCRSLPAAGLERCHCLRLPRICHPQLEPMASRDRGHSLLAWCALSCLAAPALSQRDLAWFCAARGKLPLFGNPRLLALGISGLLRFAQSLRSLLLPSPLSSLIFLPGAKASARLP